METQQNEQGLATPATDLVEDAAALKAMNDKVKTLEAQNAELMAAKKKYYDTIINGQTEEETAPFRTAKEIRKELFHSEDKEGRSNLDYMKLAIELDDACIRETGESCFVPKGKEITPTVDERDAANRFHEFMAQAIEDCDGDPEAFNSIVESKLKKNRR